LRYVPGHLVLEVRRDLQALALDDVRAVLREGNDALFEGNPYVAAALLEAADFAAVPRTSLFISPLAAAEIRALRDRAPGEIQGVVADVMRRKLLRRTERQKGSVGATDRDDIEARCGAAWRELRLAPRFERVVANHDGEDSENWDAFPVPVGDARRTLEAFVDVLEGREPPGAERWTDELVSA
jgi:guanylate kinase